MHYSIPFPENEIDRLKSLLSYHILDTLPEEELDAITRLASYICQTPISLITLLDKERQWFKSKLGFDFPEIDRKLSFCQQTILRNDFYEVPNMLDEPLFKDNPFVANGGDIRFYAGYPLTTPDGFNIGTLCVLDRIPRHLTEEQKLSLQTLAKAVIFQFELNKKNYSLQNEINHLIEEKIHQKEIDLKAYKYALDETSIVFITDPKGVIIFANEKQCQISKYSQEELIGKDAGILNSGYHTKEFIHNMWTTIQSGKTWKGEFKNKSKDGKFYWVDTSIIPFRDTNNDTYQYVAIRQDITERKLREEKLTVYEDIVKNMTAGVYVFTLDNINGIPDFTLTASNLAAFKITRINGSRMLGRKMSELFPNLMQTDMPEKFKMIALGSEPMFVGEFQYNIESFKEEYFALNAFSLPNNSIGISFDNITERKQVEIELKKATAVAEQSVITKNNFLANMSHEIRTPMNAIIGFTDILSGTNMDDLQKESVSAVKSAGENLLEIINDILDFSKIESGKLNMEKRPFNIRETLQKAIDLLRVKAKEKNISLNFSLESYIPEYVSGDRVRLNQIIVNLVGNAIKFTNKGSVTVRVNCAQESNGNCTVLFSVKDTGIGIAEDNLSTIFERFTQASSSTTRKFGGTGLGLSIVQNLIQLQGGQLEVKSVLGKGSEFIFKIAYPKVSEEKDIKKVDIHREMFSDKGIRVLLFEDNPLNQKLAGMVLKGFGFKVDLAENGRIGVDMLKNQTYDIILMDLQMPEMDGYQATRVIRNDLKLSTPIMAMTAHSLVGEKETCLGLGMNEYITKPFKQEELFSKIMQLVNKNKLTGKQYNSSKIDGSENPIDLSYLKELCDGNRDFEKQMILLFQKQVPADMELLEEGIASCDFITIKGLSHKLKSSVTIIGLASVSQSLSAIENNSATEKNIYFITDNFKKIQERINKCYHELDEILSTEYSVEA